MALHRKIELPKIQFRASRGNLLKKRKLNRYKEQNKKELLEGANNTRYYHSKANGRRRKTLIISLNQDEGVIEGQENLKRYITDFYRKLFGNLDLTNIRFNNFGIDRLTTYDCEMLREDFTMDELKAVVFEMAANKAASPYGFNAEFIKKNENS
jgi:hypothetical protein